MKRSLWMRRMAAVTALALAAAACGDGDDDVTDDTDTEVEEDSGDEDDEDGDTDSDADGDADGDDEAAGPETTEGVLNLGYVLPESGQLAFLGPPQIGALELALEDINAAGGVLGSDVTISGGDEAGDATIASESAQRLISEGVDAIIGAAASGMSQAIVDSVTSAGVLQCSGSNTAPVFSDNDYNGLYFRTAPTDALQGPVLAETVVGDGNSNPAIMARADDYGQGLLDATVTALEDQGATVAAQVTYDPEAANFDAEVSEVIDSGADSVIVISFDEGAQILSSLIEEGFGPENTGVYGADGVATNDLPGLVDPDDETVLDGMRGTRPAGGDISQDFLDRLAEKIDSEDSQYAAEIYDCVTMIALATEVAGSDEGSAIADEMVGVTTDGEECADFASCKELLDDGEDIAYQALSGVTMTRTDAGNGEPASGSYEVWEFQDGELTGIETVVSSF